MLEKEHFTESFDFGSYVLLRNPQGKQRSFVQLVIDRFNGEALYQFVGKNEGNAFYAHERERLRHLGCRSLLGADGSLVWKINTVDDGFEYAGLELDTAESYILNEDDPDHPGSEYFLIKRRTTRFQTVDTHIHLPEQKIVCSFAVLRGEQFSSVKEAYDCMIAANLKPHGRYLFDILRRITASAIPDLWYTQLQDVVGPIERICAIDPATLAYFENWIPCLKVVGIRDMQWTFSLGHSLGKSDLHADLVPIEPSYSIS